MVRKQKKVKILGGTTKRNGRFFGRIGDTSSGDQVFDIYYSRSGVLGFTLVELLVVIAIIALLLSILMPSLQRARSLAKRIACASQMKNWSMATVLYAVDNKGQFPWYADTFPAGPVSTVCYNTLARYIGGAETKLDDTTQSKANITNVNLKIRLCPAGKGGKVVIGPHFTIYNTPGQHYTAPFVWRLPNQGPVGENEPIRTEKVHSTANWVIFLDCYEWGFYSPAWLKFDWDGDKDGIKDTNRSEYYQSRRLYGWAMPKIHNNGCNMAFIDGHVEYLPFKQFLSRKWSD